ncbi:Kinesin-like protein kif24 [Geranomyces variabilis]|uniref:Kinesin-like protein n=1 Tax=Geranomyces variabilis TaxID=109894 RepID=A0AAD5TLL1_9FUNG|nr:Kinesin-like protein kif24 [Geranomyces variabilis]
MQDYGIVGIHGMEDRKRLFQLIQMLKSKFPNLDHTPPAPLPPPASREQQGLYKPTSLNNLSPAGANYPSQPIRHDLAESSLRRTASTGRLRPPSTPFQGDIYSEETAYEDQPRAPRFKKSVNTLNAYGVPLNAPGAQSAVKTGLVSSLTDRIRVCVRKRPLNSKELKKNEADIARVTGRRTVNIDEPKVKVDLTRYIEQHEFVFDEAFDAHCTNDDVYRRTAFPLVEYVFNGGKATCFAYGQTGSGKTFTMLDEKDGLYVKAGRDIFATIRQPQFSHLACWGSFYEIYQGHLYDLLNARKRLFAREDGKQQVCIAGLTEHEISDVEQLMGIFEFGNNARSTGATGANADSSRSHAIFQLVLRDKKKTVGKLSFIDLAGSERGADRGETDKQTRMEGSEINKSLLALKECIRALDLDSKHTPFRQSKLTQVLKDSFIGNSRTCMIATISPNMSNSEHTLNTLRYADRVKELKGDSHVADDRATDNSNVYNQGHHEVENPLSDTDIGYSDVDDDFLLGDDPHKDAHPIIMSSDEEDFAHQQPTRTRPLASVLATKDKPPAPATAATSVPGYNTRSRAAAQQPPATTGKASPASSSLPVPSSSASPPPATATAAAKPPPPSSQLREVQNEHAPLDAATFIRQHREHIRDMTETSRTESRLLVSLTMRQDDTLAGERVPTDSSFEQYVRELDEVMQRKLKNVLEVSDMVREVLSRFEK